MSDLDDVLNEEEPQEEIQEPQEEPQAEPQAESPKVETPEPDEAAELRKQVSGLQAALSETRGELRAFRQQSQPRPEPVQMPDVLEDPNAYSSAMMQNMQQMAMNTRAEMSEMIARNNHGDEVVDAALAAAEASGQINNFVGQRDPWGQLVKWHKNQQVQHEIGGDLSAYKEKLKAQIEAELKAELLAENVRTAATPSLAAEPNLGSRKAPAWSGPTSLDDILRG